ncbi:trafficking protein particle complex subunit 10 isoform X2 [Chelonus insularis]|uniref:trafficking protein particle complex subunit 10 isoform X2 n=1 Tax=Chelonus insularis TaxID=460826 RepID=UPI00158B1E36|nr:trafficking protein particle complex subunit 10 isoform X2 [Chelonus insularis]
MVIDAYLLLTLQKLSLVQLSHGEEIIREQRECRNLKDWNFYEYFLLQEELAFLLETLEIYDEALVQYDELDALFTQFILNSEVGDTPLWLNSFRSPLNYWTGIILKSNHHHHLRKLISDHKASLLDLRSYLFTRQCILLVLLNKPWEIAHRCLPFIYNTLSEFRILDIQTPYGSLECWAILCVMEVLDVCQFEYSKMDSSQHLDLCSLYTAGLWSLATDKLEKLGIFCGLMPGNTPTSEQLHTVVYLNAGMGDSYSQCPEKWSPIDKLKRALSSKNVFTQQYIEYSELAMGTYKHIGRLRSAKYIGIKLAKFHSHMEEDQIAATFLLEALKTYIDEGWKQLAVETQLQLGLSYKKLGDIEKYIKVSSSIASTTILDLEIRKTYHQEILKYLKMLSSSQTIPIELKEAFNIHRIEVKVNNKATENCTVEIYVVVECRLPYTIKEARVVMFVHEVIENSRYEGKKLLLDSLPKSSCEASFNHIYSPNLKENDSEVVSYLNHQEDKSIRSVGIINKRIKQSTTFHSRFKDNQKISDDRTISEKVHISKNLILKPGLNDFVISEKVNHSGLYKINGISIVLFNVLEYQLQSLDPELVYNITKTHPVITLNSKNLFAGLMQDVELIIQNGSDKILKHTTLNVWTTKGVKITLPDKAKTISDRLEILLSDYEPFKKDKIAFGLFAQIPMKKDSQSLQHQLFIQLSWGPEIKIPLNFELPLISQLKVYTIGKKKYLQIAVTGVTNFFLQLFEPKLSTNALTKISLKSLNIATPQKQIIRTGIKNFYMWELESYEHQDPSQPIQINFYVKYSPVQGIEGIRGLDIYDDPLHIKKHSNMENLINTYQYSFELSNFNTLFMILSKIETSGNGGDFCRAGSICHLCVIIKRMVSLSNFTYLPQLMYEVLTDHSMWAVCGRTAGILTLNDTDEQSVTLDVMPLKSGYLPLPIVRLSRYIAAIEPKSDPFKHVECSGPKLEPFNVGQVYNASKSQQIYVLPAASIEFY